MKQNPFRHLDVYGIHTLKINHETKAYLHCWGLLPFIITW